MSSDDVRREPELILNSESSGENNNQSKRQSLNTNSSVANEKNTKFAPRIMPMWILIGAVVLVAVLWVIGDFISEKHVDEASIPLISANNDPLKVRPDNPGGKKIENRDKYVYKSLTNEEVDTTIEQILPPAEEPLVESPLDLNNDNEKEKISINGEVSSTQKIEDQETLTIQEIEEVISDKPQLKDINTQATNASENIDLKVENENTNISEKKSENATNIDEEKNYFQVQIAASKNRKALLNDWKKMKNKNSDLLEGFNLELSPIDSGSKNTFLRSRIGNFINKKTASELCISLKNRGIDCFVTKK
tara:strand:- start:2011 stop:2931 length:921 start_codon:yes stop_codon:yes gene_type:complete